LKTRTAPGWTFSRKSAFMRITIPSVAADETPVFAACHPYAGPQ